MKLDLTKFPPSDEFKEIIENAKDWALLTGLSIRSSEQFDRDGLQFLSFTLLPSALPREVYSEACAMQTILNELTHRVAYDYEFLKETLKETTKVDFFTKKLFDLYETVRNEGFAQEISLGLLRSDFMLDNQTSWKQVEINTIACGCGWFGPSTSKLHKYVLQEMGMRSQIRNIPDNNSLEGMSSGMVEAWKLYNDERSGILFVVEDVTHNICEQRAHEFKIKKLNPKIKVFRRTLTQLIVAATLGVNKELILDGNTIAVVYFRCGYEPSQYPTEAEWDVRLMIERSKAIKCPSIQYHLAGTKKVQQVLTRPGVVEKFLNGEKISSRVRKIYTGMYSLDFTVEGDKAIEMAIANPENFVLKPQREGGGNNIFGTNIKTFLQRIKGKKERTSWILMDTIYPPSQKNYFIRPGSDVNYEKIDADYEVGIFGVIIGDSRNIFFNEQAGYMVRSKPVSANEGGRLSGGALSSIYLV